MGVVMVMDKGVIEYIGIIRVDSIGLIIRIKEIHKAISFIYT